MKLVLVCILCVVAVLGSALYVRAAPQAWEQFHDSYEEEQPEIGASPKDNAGYGKKVDSHKPIQSGGTPAAAKKESILAVHKEASAGREAGSALRSSNAGRKSSSIASAKEYQKREGDHFDHEGHEADKLHGGDHDRRAERPGKSVASKAW